MRCGDTVRSVSSFVLRAWYSSQSFWRFSVADATVLNAAPAGRAAIAGKRRRCAASPKFKRWCFVSSSRRFASAPKCSSSKPPPASLSSRCMIASACSSLAVNQRPGSSNASPVSGLPYL